MHRAARAWSPRRKEGCKRPPRLYRAAAFWLVVAAHSPVGAQIDPVEPRDLSIYPVRPGLFWTDLGFSVVFDTNIELTPSPVRGPGLLGDVRAQLRTSISRPFLRLEYRGGMRQYRATTKWNRNSHVFLGVVQQYLGPLGMDVTGTWQLANETEDRDIADVYLISPRVSIRARGLRLRAYRRFWSRVFHEDAERRETIRTDGGDLRLRAFDRLEWKVGFREEVAESSRRGASWVRRSVSLEWRTKLSETTTLLLEADRREREYPDRRVEIGDDDFPLTESDWISSVWLTRGKTVGPQVGIGHEYRVRTSNNARREYGAHRTVLSFRAPLFGWVRDHGS